MKYLSNGMAAVLVLVCFFLPGIVFGKENKSVNQQELLYFNNNYKGLRPGKTTFNETIQILGKPIRIEKTANGANYQFQGVVVNFSGQDRDKINTININNDFYYVCPNGIRLNDDVRRVKDVLRQPIPESAFYDNRNGIFYWHNGKHITKIVLAYSAYKYSANK